ncbi:MAG TPA: hypothetical protein VF331_16620 [Polyangiales bacterium]
MASPPVYPIRLPLQLSWWLLGCLFVCPGAARADARPCGRAGRPWVALVFNGESWQPALRESITADLRAGLRLRGIEVCALGTEGSEPPLALVQLGSAPSERVSVSIDVHDSVTEKRVLRDLDLHAVTPDSRGLSVAQAAEELLRASWAELALEGAPKPAQPPPAEVTAAVTPPPDHAARATGSHDFGVRFAVAHHGSGQSLFGADVLFGLWPGRWVGCELALGVRQGLPVDAQHGSVQSSATAASLALRFLLSRGGRHDAFVRLGAEIVDLQLRGRPNGSGVGSTASALAAGAEAALVLRLALTGDVHVRAEVGLGLPLRGVSAADGGQRVSSTLGLALHGALGLGVVF